MNDPEGIKSVETALSDLEIALRAFGRFGAWLVRNIRQYGIKVVMGALLASAAGSGGALTILAIRADVPLVREAAGTDITNIVAPTGVQGFKVAEFCNDDLTKVLLLPAPDAVGNGTYQLTRDKGGVFETVVVPSNFASATHYYDAVVALPTQVPGTVATPQARKEQQSEPGAMTDEAKACIEQKAKV